MIRFLLLAFLGAFSVAFCGVSQGAIYGPITLFLGVETRISFTTAAYMSVLTTLVASILLIFFKMIRLDYAVYVAILTILGTLPGYFFQQYFLREYKRVSFMIGIGCTCLFTATTSMFILGIPP